MNISADIKALIWSAKKGEKGDIKFVKELAIVAFGPEVFAASSVYGTLRGQKKGDESSVKKPPLDKTTLAAIRGKLSTVFFNIYYVIMQHKLSDCYICIW